MGGGVRESARNSTDRARSGLCREVLERFVETANRQYSDGAGSAGDAAGTEDRIARAANAFLDVFLRDPDSARIVLDTAVNDMEGFKSALGNLKWPVLEKDAGASEAAGSNGDSIIGHTVLRDFPTLLVSMGLTCMLGKPLAEAFFGKSVKNEKAFLEAMRTNLVGLLANAVSDDEASTGVARPAKRNAGT
jgi:hypothetical protein